MINTTKLFRLFAALCLVFLILEISTTESKPLSEESIKLDSDSSGANSIPEELKDDDFNGEDDKGSGESMLKETTKQSLQSNGITDKQVDKLIQAQDLGTGESEGSAENSIPEFKEANDGSGEVIEVENKDSKEKNQEFGNTLESTKDMSAQKEKPTIVTPTGNEVQQGAQVFTDTTAAGQQQPYSTDAPAPAGQYYNDAQPQQTYTDASAQPATAAATQPAAYSADAAASAQPQYYGDASKQTTSAAQPATQTYSDAAAQAPVAQASAEKIPAPIDVAMEATHPGEQASYFAPNNPATQASQVLNDANGVPQPVDAASMAAAPQLQYYNNQAQQASQQTVANDQAAPLVADNSAALQQWNTATADAQQPMQYTSQTSQQNALNSYQNDQSQAPLSPEEKMREADQSAENKFRTVVCQNNQDIISCPQGKKINIVDAHYGSMGASACQGLQSNFLPMQPCETPGAYQTVKTSCDDVENCVLSANDGIFGDKCQSDRKYLDVTYKCEANEEPNQAQQFYYPNGQPAAPAYSPYNQGSPYGYQQQEQRYNDEQKVDLPPPPKIPELMSTLVQLSKNRRRYPATCSSCNKCSQCYKSARCAQCDFCKNRLCDEAATSMPLIPKNLRPLWEMWNERTADMNSMEMSALILKPFHKIKKSKAKKVHGSSSKRSHIKKPKITQVAKKSTKKNSKN